MSNFADDIEQAVARTGEPIQSIVVGDHLGWGDGRPADGPGKVQTWADARPLLDYDYSTGYGSPACHAVQVFTRSYTFIVGIYDGSTWLQRIPRIARIAARDGAASVGG